VHGAGAPLLLPTLSSENILLFKNLKTFGFYNKLEDVAINPRGKGKGIPVQA
jgi:hypothetical protein